MLLGLNKQLQPHEIKSYKHKIKNQTNKKQKVGNIAAKYLNITHNKRETCLTAFFPGRSGWAATRSNKNTLQSLSLYFPLIKFLHFLLSSPYNNQVHSISYILNPTQRPWI